MAACNLAGDIIAHLIFSLLLHRDNYRPAMDRTNRKFGETNINVLTIAVIHDGVAFPLLITMLNKRGNSHTDERIEIMNRFIRLFAHLRCGQGEVLRPVYAVNGQHGYLSDSKIENRDGEPELQIIISYNYFLSFYAVKLIIFI
ncbi:MAG: hypothetical protein LBS42_01295 [Tannerella sp.]|nr:hypothetical protein [Tannerella sp.]